MDDITVVLQFLTTIVVILTYLDSRYGDKKKK